MTEAIKDNIDYSQENEDIPDYTIDFTTSSAISRVNVKFLAVYIPCFWLSGLLVVIYWYEISRDVQNWIFWIAFLPISFICMYFIFILGCMLFSKLLLILINLIHKPKEGIFLAEIGDTDFEFWCLRTELKKIVLWLIRNCPLPWIDVVAFRWFGVSMDYSSHMQDAWCDIEFLTLGRKSLVGQGAVVMTSMVVGKYLIIKRVILDDYVLIGGQSTVAPGTLVGRDSMLGAVSITTFKQMLEDGWIYTGIPARKYKPNKLAETRRDVISKISVDEEARVEVEHEINIDDDKKDQATL
jgi:carbonic anhydrase/acetyltransferase-like protein (isoleucine patch superfamily)